MDQIQILQVLTNDMVDDLVKLCEVFLVFIYLLDSGENY